MNGFKNLSNDTATIEAMKNMYLESSTPEEVEQLLQNQHNRMLDEQTKLLASYKKYSDVFIKQMKSKTKITTSTNTDIAQGISEISTSLDIAIKRYSKEIQDIILQLEEKL